MHHARGFRVLRAAAPLAAAALALGGLALPLAAGPAAWAASPSPLPSTPPGMAMEARALVQGHARMGSWMAIRVDLANDGPAFAGELRLVGGTQGRTRFSVPVDLPTTSRKAYTLNAQAPAFGSTLEVALVADEAIVTKRTVAFALHDAGQLVVGVVAERPGPLVAALGRLRDPSGPVPAVVGLAPADLPDRPEAWAVLDRLVWQDVDAGALSPEQAAALRTWLAGGGRLTIVGGTGGPGLLAGFPEGLLPFRPAATLDVDPATLRGLLGGAVPRGAEALAALAGETAAGARALAVSGDRAIAADRSFGSGAVTLVGFDPTTPWLAESTAADGLWATIVPARGTSRAPLVVGDDSIVVSALASLPALALPPIEGLLLLLIAYIALIGPLNYLVLRRLDRREWAWVTMPLLVAGFALAAFGIGAVLRGTDVIVNEVALVRAAPGTDAAQAQVYLGVFSPSRAAYDLTVPGGALLSAPYSGEVFGQAGGGGLDVVQGDPSRVRGLAVGYGALRAVRAEAPVSAPTVEADLRLAAGSVTGAIRNASAETLEDAVLVLGAGVQALGDLAPGAAATVRLRSGKDPFGQALSERIFGTQQFPADGRTTPAFLRDQVRRQLVDALTFDPTFGSSGTLPADGPVLLAWGPRGLLPVAIAGQEPRTMGETLYYLPLGLAAAGRVAFTPDLMRSSVVEVSAQYFARDPFNVTIGAGTATLAYRPIPVSGTIAATRLAIGANLGTWGPIAGSAATVPSAGAGEPAATPAPSSGPVAAPPVPEPIAPTLPTIELLDRPTGTWRTVDGLVSGRAVDIADPARFVDAASGTILLRLSYDRPESIGFQLAIQLEGEIR